MKLKNLIFIILLNNILFSQELQIVYEEREPYIIKEDNSLKGLVATPIINALSKAKIKYILEEKPSKRHLYEIKNNRNKICALGWFKNPEREKFSKFSKRVYQDKSLGIVARSDRKDDFEHISLENLLKKDYEVLTKVSYSYGSFLDEKLKKYKTKKKEVYANNEKMLLLIERKRADYMFISEEESDFFLKKNNHKELSFFKIANMPKGNNRYLICSKKVNDKIINQINDYLK